MAWLTLLATATACLSLLFLPLMPSQKEEVRRLAELPRSRAAGWAMLALLAFLVVFGTALRPGPVNVDVRSLHTVVCEQARPSPCCQSSRRRPASPSPAERGARAALLAAGCRKVPERRGVPERRRAALPGAALARRTSGSAGSACGRVFTLAAGGHGPPAALHTHTRSIKRRSQFQRLGHRGTHRETHVLILIYDLHSNFDCVPGA